MGTLSLKTTVTTDNPKRDTERISSTFMMLLIATSMGKVMSCSTSWGGERRRYGDDLYLVVGDIRYGVHRKSQHRIDSSCQQEERGQSDEEFFRYRKADYVLKHGVVKVDFSRQNYVSPDRIAEKICRSALFSG